MNTQTIIDILYLALTSGFALGLLKIVFDVANTYIKDAKVKKIILDIETAVESTAQTYVDSLKKDGKFDTDAAMVAKDKAIELAKELIGTDGADLIKELYGDVSKYLDAKIEEIIKDKKK